MKINLKDAIYIFLIIVLFVGNMIYQNKVRKLEKEREEELYSELFGKISTLQSTYLKLNVKIDSLRVQNDSIKTAQYESIKINKQAKERADRAIRAYRDIVVTLPAY